MPRKPDMPPGVYDVLVDLRLRLKLSPGRPAEVIAGWYREAKDKVGPRAAEVALWITEAGVSPDRVAQYPSHPDGPGTEIRGDMDDQPKASMVVITLHGIKTRGAWQKDLVPILHDAGYKSVPLDYDYFLALKMIMPGQRRKKVDWFRDEYERVCDRERVDRPSIIAHSFGTYLVARAMQKYRPVKFDRVILCGSIVQREYPWSSIVRNEQAVAVMNDFGRMDFWAGIVAWAVSDAGQSGRHGFNDLSDGKVEQVDNPEFRHGDYFSIGNYKESWIPFLRAAARPRPEPTPRPVSNTRFRFAIGILLVVLLAIISTVYMTLR